MSSEQQSAWFAAAHAFDTERMAQLLAEGVSINTVDRLGRTALFYATAPWGGRPEAVAWLIARGVDVNVRDAQGQSAVQAGHANVTSALEANMARENERRCRAAGYVSDVGERKGSRSPRRRP